MGQPPKQAGSVRDHSNDLEVLSHELGNVLNGLSGMAGLLRASRLDARQSRWLSVIEQSAGQMSRLLRRAQAAGEQPLIEPFNGIDLMEQLLILHTPAAEAKNLRLLLVPSPDLSARWQTDAGMLRQLLDNLVGNALKYTPSGQVVIRVRRGREDALCVQVADTGPGLSVEERRGVFDARVRGTAARGIPGNGLGLAVCERIVGQLGGRMEFNPADGGGAEFSVRLPGVVTGSARERGKSVALSKLCCELDLDGELLASVGSILRRLGIAWHRVGSETGAGGRGLNIRVGCCPLATRAGLLALRLESGDSSRETVRLTAPVLPSTLEPALLRLALAWRWGRLRDGGTPG